MTRSAAASRLAQGESDGEVREAITPALRAEVIAALAGARREAHPAHEAKILAEIGAFLAIVGQDWSKAGRDEFMDRAICEFEDLPGVLLLDALTRVRRRLWDGKRLVVWIFDELAEPVAKLKAEIQTLERLADLAAD